MASDSLERVQPNPDLILANWRNELDSAALYRHLAAREKDESRAALLTEMADSESRHARVMERGLRELGIKLPAYKVGFRTRVLKVLASSLGPRAVYPLLPGTEMTGSVDYAGQDARTAALAGEERSHARTLAQLSGPVPQLGTERWHRSAGGGSLRAAVFGVNDGLVSNLSLVMGFAGAAADASFVLLAGLAGLLAGASSMAAGEYVSVKAQRELFERQIQLEATELSVTPEEETRELALIYRAKGVPKIDAERLAGQLSADPEVALDSLVREELGLDPAQLGSPIAAAVSSFFAFAAGAVLPVIPFFFGAEAINVGLALLLSCAALFTVGALISVFTGRSVLFSGARQLAIGLAAAMLTFAVGKAIGVTTDV
jgi:VIT1/CCC1 family predicted Fe2+/Mn2+ transporter